MPKDPTNRAYDRFEPQPIWVYPNVVKGLQVEAPNRGSGSGSDLCSVTGRLRVPGLSAGWVFTPMYRLEPFSTDGCTAAEASLWRWHWPTATVSAGLIHHSDRGRQYWSNEYVERLLDFGVSKSHFRSWPAHRERVREIASQKTVKWEEVYLHQYRTFEEAAAELADVSGRRL